MRVVVTGKKGQVAQALAERQADWPEIELVFLARPEFDLAEVAGVEAQIARLKPHAVVNAAAYTAVDQAEDEPELAQRINADAAGRLARTAREAGALIIQLSTDYVFDGTLDRAYLEEDDTGPVTAYGQSKLDGERRVISENPAHVVMRTAWVYSSFGRNFVKSILRRAVEAGQLSVVSDQRGNPTSALDIAEAVFKVLDAVRAGGQEPVWGTYHLAGAEEGTWHDFACEIIRQGTVLGGPDVPVEAVTTDAFPTKARRPSNSRLDSGKFLRRFGFAPAGYREALKEVLPRLLDRSDAG
ncbi:MAG: dTDP-4-dehydrorhamnose reductase [Pseudomonadota bacterium]